MRNILARAMLRFERRRVSCSAASIQDCLREEARCHRFAQAVSDVPRVSPLAPFRVRNFRFQWPADLATSWAFEMETIILGWYVLVETKSVLMLTLFASLQYVGTLVAPLFGVIGDRLGHRNMLCAMRATYATLATTLMTLAFTSWLQPLHVFVIATIMGLIRPSDQVMRYSLIGAIMPRERLMIAIGIARTTQDSARIVGALLGTGLSAALGMGLAYAVIACLYATSFALTLQVRPVAAPAPASRGKLSPSRARPPGATSRMVPATCSPGTTC